MDVNHPTCKHGASYNRDYIMEGITLGAPFPQETVDRAIEFPFAPTDMVMASYPRSGEGILYEIVWLLMNEADTEGALNTPLSRRVPLLELTALEGREAEPALEKLHVEEPPRVMATHLPFALLGPALQKGRPRVMVVVRDPRQLVLALYNSYRRWPGRELPSFMYFFETFVKTDRLLFGNHFDHLLGYWLNAKSLNMLVLKYDDLINDIEDSVLKISNYLEKDLNPKQMHSIVKFMTARVDTMDCKAPVVNTIVGVRMFESDMGEIQLEDKDELGQEKEKEDMTKVDIDIVGGGHGGDVTTMMTAAELFAPADLPPMEVEFFYAPKRLRLSPDQIEYLDSQCRELLEPEGLTF